ncbi:hypothetical protein HYPSUDRAFT_483740 [Hypholoma sublateritium FD-334 SS-4]|uniref:Uncharacterized protein n=1 Tax=Hypholoma sublateritium (strain FD-334 SS-4) TaxID=945553 RepID=A0A0D2NZM9_HYPSF|nr:hypothetical protein HYPSUDRAFT_483740 [Hypholoma sublateritium FD-334 SS-4]
MFLLAETLRSVMTQQATAKSAYDTADPCMNGPPLFAYHAAIAANAASTLARSATAPSTMGAMSSGALQTPDCPRVRSAAADAPVHKQLQHSGCHPRTVCRQRRRPSRCSAGHPHSASNRLGTRTWIRRLACCAVESASRSPTCEAAGYLQSHISLSGLRPRHCAHSVNTVLPVFLAASAQRWP